MKKFLLSLAAMALVGSASAANTLTITYDNFPTDQAQGYKNFEVTQDGAKFQINNAYANGTNQIRVNQTGNSGFEVYNTTSIGGIQNVVLTVEGATNLGAWYMSTSNTASISTSVTTSTAGAIQGSLNGTTSVTFTVPTGTDASYFHFNLTTKGGGTVKLTSLVITYTGEIAGGGDTGGDTGDGNPVAYNAPFAGKTYNMTVGETLNIERGDKYPSEMVFVLPENQTALSENDDAFTLTAIAAGTVEVEVMWEEDDNFTDGDASFTVIVTEPQSGGDSGDNPTEDTFTDVLTWNLFDGISSTNSNYSNCTYTSPTTQITYSANMSSGQGKYIQLRNGSSSGIVTTANKSGLIFKSISIKYNSGTTNARQVTVYGSDNNYSSSSDLYGDNKGTSISDLKYSTSEATVSLSPKTDADFIGLGLLASGALYIESITIEWEKIKGDANPMLSFPESSYEAIIDNTFDSPKATSDAGSTGAISYSSSDTSVATVDEGGNITLLEGGTTTITATIAAVEGYTEGSASYQLTVYERYCAPMVNLVFGASTGQDSQNSYENEWTVMANNVSWTITNFNNNGNAWDFIRCGSKNSVSDASITSTETINALINKIEITAQKGASITTIVNSAEFLISKSKDMSAPVFTKDLTDWFNGLSNSTPSTTSFDIDFPTTYAAPSKAAPYYYQLTFNTPKYSSSNGGVQINNMVLLGNIDYDISTGVEAIGAEAEGEAQYFTIDGVKLQNPDKGLYIKVVGGKATKVIL